MSNKNIRLSITSTNDKGYSHVSLMIGDDNNSLNDCGALYLSESELDILADGLRDGLRDAGDVSFEIEDTTLVQEY